MSLEWEQVIVDAVDPRALGHWWADALGWVVVSDEDRDAEVARLLGLGATRADVGQGDETWVVLADPEGNELCVLSSRTR